MLKSYLIIERTALPDYFIKVVEARRLLESGACTQISDAVREVGISRSTYYKYKGKIIEPSELNVGRRASLMLSLNHETGMLSQVLNSVSDTGANILTITQSLPIHEKANIMLTLDMSHANQSIEQLIQNMEAISGVDKIRLLAID